MVTPETLGNRDHGGGLDVAIDQYGGERSEWIDLSTGINPVPYPVPTLSQESWAALPDTVAEHRLLLAARTFWQVPDGADILAAPGASALIAALPGLVPSGAVHIPTPTYNEHAAAFAAQGWEVHEKPAQGLAARVLVHPNNPTGRWYTEADLDAPLTIIDESFADVAPDRSLVGCADQPGLLILKSFGKFWGLAGLRLGFAMGDPRLIAPLRERLGPWPVSGPAQTIGTAALADHDWARVTRTRLNEDAARLDALMHQRGASCIGGTSLFRLYEVDEAADWQTRLARKHIWSRVFPYSGTWLRLGLPAPHNWARLEAAL